jgi:ADP-heptose:LPS heptosyltransferase
MENPFKFDLVPYTRGVGIEITPAETKTFPHFIKWNNEALHLLAKQSMDFVYYISPEMGSQWGQEDLKDAWGLVKTGGHLCLTLDHETSGQMLMSAFPGWIIQEHKNVGKWGFYVFEKTANNKMHVGVKVEGKTCAVLRYGGIGDMMLASNIFPGLKRQGYHITLYTHTNSLETIKFDPHIDKIIIQDSGQVPGEEFRDFVFSLKKKYTKVINLSESIEGTLLSLPDRVSYYWPKELRSERNGMNHYEITAKIAGVPKKLEGKFYPTQGEINWAKKQRKKMGGKVLLWVLSGSSVHKFWPWLDQAVARIMLNYPEWKVVFVGDEISKLLAMGWEKEKRVFNQCGLWDIRKTMTFCGVADGIVTPETGVALSVSFKNIPKILLLSHSAPKSYAEDWNACIPLTPDNCECYPCHQMHYGWEYCNSVEICGENEEESATVAKCQANISVDKFMGAFNKIVRNNL